MSRIYNTTAVFHFTIRLLRALLSHSCATNHFLKEYIDILPINLIFDRIRGDEHVQRMSDVVSLNDLVAHLETIHVVIREKDLITRHFFEVLECICQALFLDFHLDNSTMTLRSHVLWQPHGKQSQAETDKHYLSFHTTNC